MTNEDSREMYYTELCKLLAGKLRQKGKPRIKLFQTEPNRLDKEAWCDLRIVIMGQRSGPSVDHTLRLVGRAGAKSVRKK